MTKHRLASREPALVAKLESHRLLPMRGRDLGEAHRSGTPLETLFDLAFATGFSLTALQFTHFVSEGRLGTAFLGFGLSVFAICWAWINFSWFSSAYDTDDWVFRLTTMMQMVGVTVLSLGVPRMFLSLEHSDHLDNTVMVLGYVIMRLAMMSLWLRAARQDIKRRKACLTYAVTILVAQVCWVLLVWFSPTIRQFFAIATLLAMIELLGPVMAETRAGGTPWHAQHIAERYGSLANIALGEGVAGTVAVVSADVQAAGWSLGVILVCSVGTAITFGLWWIYFMLPSAQVLRDFRGRSFVWGYTQILLFASIAAIGAGLNVAGETLQGKSHISELATLLSVAIPVALYILVIYGLHYWLVRVAGGFHVLLLALTTAVLAGAVAMASGGVPLEACLALLAAAPAVTVVGYEVLGFRRRAEALVEMGVPEWEK